MPLANELEAGLFTLLTSSTAITDNLADGTAGVWASVAPQNADAPMVVFSRQSDTPAWQMTAISYEAMLVNIRAITIGESEAVAGTIAKGIETAMNDGTLTVASHSTIYTRKESGVAFPEVIEGQRYNHRGGLYRIWLAPS